MNLSCNYLEAGLHSRQVVKNRENPTRVSIFLKSDQKFKVKSKVKSKVKPNFFSSHFTVTLFLKFKLNVNSNENESKNASGGACARGAKRPHVGVLPVAFLLSFSF